MDPTFINGGGDQEYLAPVAAIYSLSGQKKPAQRLARITSFTILGQQGTTSHRYRR
jgi:hypothetical protein